MLKQLRSGDTIIFNSVSRMSRNSDEGFKDYKYLYELGVGLVFINKPLINTKVLENSETNILNISVETGYKAVDEYFRGNITLTNNLLMALAEEQIKTVFEQCEKEVNDLHTRISQSIREAQRNGTKVGIEKGTKLIADKSVKCKEIIKKHSKDFNGTLEGPDIIKLC